MPAPKRVHGYYVLPFLHDEALRARVDLKSDRKAGVLRVVAAWLEPGRDAGGTAEALAAELRRAAAWQGLERRRRGAARRPRAGAGRRGPRARRAARSSAADGPASGRRACQGPQVTTEPVRHRAGRGRRPDGGVGCRGGAAVGLLSGRLQGPGAAAPGQPRGAGGDTSARHRHRHGRPTTAARTSRAAYGAAALSTRAVGRWSTRPPECSAPGRPREGPRRRGDRVGGARGARGGGEKGCLAVHVQVARSTRGTTRRSRTVPRARRVAARPPAGRGRRAAGRLRVWALDGCGRATRARRRTSSSTCCSCGRGGPRGAATVELPMSDNRHVVALVHVHPAHRRRGVGSPLLKAAEEHAHRHRRTTLMVELDEPPHLAGRSPGPRGIGRRGPAPGAARGPARPRPARRPGAPRRRSTPRARRTRRLRRPHLARPLPRRPRRRPARLSRRISTDAPLGELDWDEEEWDAARVRRREDAVLRRAAPASPPERCTRRGPLGRVHRVAAARDGRALPPVGDARAARAPRPPARHAGQDRRAARLAAELPETRTISPATPTRTPR